MIALVSTPIDVGALLDDRTDPGAGGLVVFVGRVRDHSHGRAVVRLEYEAYPSMAEKELDRLCGTARSRFDITEIDVVHRVGVLGIGAVAVAIVVQAPHRDAAFDACRFAIDELKQTVPIWKKEVFADGEEWVSPRP
ncbi:MAG: molybdenum cofactor biosynthesis protein MoaE [Planctomycetes bacterium]|nr:molybdenum cofactor biosynthesis protein MoaE [Planctomycetota bacterium]